MDFEYFTQGGTEEEPEFTHKHRDFSISVEASGISIYGTYGWNSSAKEMSETAEVMRICVAAYDRLKESSQG